MARAKYQVLVIPFYIENNEIQYAIFRRSDFDAWQFIAGGGEEEDGSPLFSAKREAFEEAHIPMDERYVQLETKCSIATEHFPEARKLWGDECLVIPEYSFAVRLTSKRIKLSNEHIEYKWVNYEIAKQSLKFDSNVVALWELENKFKLDLIK